MDRFVDLRIEQIRKVVFVRCRILTNL